MTYKFFRSYSQFLNIMNPILCLMPKGFSEEEKSIIKNQLIEKGIELFSKFGLKKTNIEDITRAVGIAKGSFYSFYERGKEELFLDVFLKVQEDIKDEFTKIIKKFSKDPLESLKSFIKLHIEIRNENPIIQTMSDKTTRGIILRKLSGYENLDKYLQEYEYLPNFIKNWQKQGIFTEGDPNVLAGILKAIFTIGMDEETVAYISMDKFEQVMDQLIDIIAKYMIVKKPTK